MIEILGLLGILWAVSGSFQMPDLSGSDGGGDTAAPDPVTVGEGPDLVADAAWWSEIEALIDRAEAGGTLTPDEAARLRDAAERTTGPLDLDTGGGADTVFGSAAEDRIETGAADDIAFGGAGDDRINLGDGDDAYGVAEDDPLSPLRDRLEAGNDTVRGGAGDDSIHDGSGSNLLQGWQGDDVLSAVDRDGFSPDTLEGGIGSDTLLADRGDTVSTGSGFDTVTIVLPDSPSGQAVPVTLLDFERGTDRIEIDLPAGLGAGAVALRDDGPDAVLSVDGVDEVRIAGGAGLALRDVVILA